MHAMQRERLRSPPPIFPWTFSSQPSVQSDHRQAREIVQGAAELCAQTITHLMSARESLLEPCGKAVHDWCISCARSDTKFFFRQLTFENQRAASLCTGFRHALRLISYRVRIEFVGDSASTLHQLDRD